MCGYTRRDRVSGRGGGVEGEMVSGIFGILGDACRWEERGKAELGESWSR
jgi:hypothetical protein